MSGFEITRCELRSLVMEVPPVTWSTYDRHRWDSDIPEQIRGAAEAAHLLVPDEAECDTCSNSVGYVLIDDDDRPHSGGAEWNWTTAAFTDLDGPIVFVCEDCSPHHLHDALDPTNSRYAKREASRAWDARYLAGWEREARRADEDL